MRLKNSRVWLGRRRRKARSKQFPGREISLGKILRKKKIRLFSLCRDFSVGERQASYVTQRTEKLPKRQHGVFGQGSDMITLDFRKITLSAL